MATANELSKCDLLAYYSYSWAEGRLLEAGANRVKDREAYEYLEQNGLPDEKDSPQLASEFVGYTLPVFDSWVRKVRNGRKVLGNRKHLPRTARPHGRGIVREQDVEPPAADD
jgi:hypothetical protein